MITLEESRPNEQSNNTRKNKSRLLRIWPRFFQFYRFMIVGGLTALLNIGLYIFLRKLGIHFLVANIISVGAAIVLNFIWNRRWTFEQKDKSRARRQLTEYIALNSTTYILKQFLLYFGVLLFPLPLFWIPSDYVVKFVLLLSIGIFKFIINYRWIFNSNRK